MSRLSAVSEWAETLGALEAGQLAENISDKGLELKKDFQRKGSDSTGYIGVHALLSLFSQVRTTSRNTKELKLNSRVVTSYQI